jgi:menaquinone-dependent protoporphyrinogen IX oxidase
MADRQGDAWTKAKDAYLLKISEKYGLSPVSYGFFGGILDFSRSHGFLIDILVKINGRRLKENGLDTGKICDTRDWGKIESWAFEVAEAASNRRQQ